MGKTKVVIFMLVAIWVAFYVAIVFTQVPGTANPKVVSGVSMQKNSYSPLPALIEQRFQTKGDLDQAPAAQQAVPVPVTGGRAGEAWISLLVFFSAAVLVGICGWLLVQHA